MLVIGNGDAILILLIQKHFSFMYINNKNVLVFLKIKEFATSSSTIAKMLQWTSSCNRLMEKLMKIFNESLFLKKKHVFRGENKAIDTKKVHTVRDVLRAVHVQDVKG